MTETQPDPAHSTAPTRDEQEREVARAREEQRGGDPPPQRSIDRAHHGGDER